MDVYEKNYWKQPLSHSTAWSPDMQVCDSQDWFSGGNNPVDRDDRESCDLIPRSNLDDYFFSHY